MGAGLKASTRKWYEEEIMKVLKKNGKVSVGEIMQELRKNPQRRYPIQEERICSFLKFLRACGRVSYTKSSSRRIPSKWGSKEE